VRLEQGVTVRKQANTGRTKQKKEPRSVRKSARVRAVNIVTAPLSRRSHRATDTKIEGRWSKAPLAGEILAVGLRMLQEEISTSAAVNRRWLKGCPDMAVDCSARSVVQLAARPRWPRQSPGDGYTQTSQVGKKSWVFGPNKRRVAGGGRVRRAKSK